MAAGVTLSRQSLEEFRSRMNSLVQTAIPAEFLQPALRLDGEVSLGDLSLECLHSFAQLDPLGQGNPPVQFAARSLQLRGEPRRMGKEGQHLRFNVGDSSAVRQAVWWNCPQEFRVPSRFDLAFAPELNCFEGSYSVQLKVLDLKPADS